MIIFICLYTSTPLVFNTPNPICAIDKDGFQSCHPTFVPLWAIYSGSIHVNWSGTCTGYGNVSGAFSGNGSKGSLTGQLLGTYLNSSYSGKYDYNGNINASIGGNTRVGQILNTGPTKLSGYGSFTYTYPGVTTCSGCWSGTGTAGQ